MVSVCRESTRNAPKTSLGDSILFRNMLALRAGARGVSGVHWDRQATGTLSLVRQDRQELSPTRVEDAAVESCLRSGSVRKKRSIFVGVGPGGWCLRQTRNVEPLVCDHVVIAN
jgi:hypothetical protein